MPAKDLTAALHALTQDAIGQSSRQDISLPAEKPVAPIPARTGSASPPTPTGGGGSGEGGSIASPLTETDYAARTWHPYRTVYTTDGLFCFRFRAPSSIKFKDANQAAVEIRLALPTSAPAS